MKDNRGQALVEFIIVMPIFLMVVLAIIDFGTIYHTKYTMQNDLDVIANLYKNKHEDEYKNYANNKDLKVKTYTDNNLTTIEIARKIQIMTPGLNKVFGNPYEIKESITVYEQ